MSTGTKRNLQSAIADAAAFRKLFDGCYERWEIAGSVRRKVPWVGDIEHVVIPKVEDRAGAGLFAEPVRTNLLMQRCEELLVAKTVKPHLYTAKDGRTSHRWGEKMRGMDYRGFTHELYSADTMNWGSALAIRTGPWQLSKDMVTRLYANGYCNNLGYVRTLHRWHCACGWEDNQPDLVMNGTEAVRQYCPRCRKPDPEGVIVPCETEEQFFKFAGLPFVAPEKRDIVPAGVSVAR